MSLLTSLGERWIVRLRASHRPLAAGLPEEAQGVLARFFPTETLETACLAIVPRIRAPFRGLLGITFDDTIVVLDRVRGPALVSTLFHELVHVEQARQLGLRRFVERYLRGWLQNGRRYASIPLERDAYDLQRRFEAAPAAPFDAAAEIARRLAANSPCAQPSQ